MAGKWPKIRSRQSTPVSPWVSMIAREVEFSADEPPQLYHAVAQADYVAIVAVTQDGRIPLVRQYRPVLEGFSWELPAGLVDGGEDPAESCRRELLEETGFSARAIHRLADTSPCTGRLNNRIYSFFVEAGARAGKLDPEPGVSVKLVTPEQLVRMITRGEFVSQLHLGALLLAELHGYLALPRKATTRPAGRPARPPTRRKPTSRAK